MDVARDNRGSEVSDFDDVAGGLCGLSSALMDLTDPEVS